MSLILDDLGITPHSQLEGREIKKAIKEAKEKGETETAKLLEGLNQVGEMADRALRE